MTNVTKKIDFSNLGGPVYSGRDKGDLTRKKLNIDQLDTSDIMVKVVIPENTYSITSSFFLGLFGKSIRISGSKENFYNKYHFDMPDRFKLTFDQYTERVLREKTALLQ